MSYIEITASISTDILAIIVLCITICFANRNPVVNKNKNKIFLSVSVLTIVLLVLELLTILMALSNSNKFMMPHRIANILGFSLSPVVPFILIFFYYNNKKIIFHNRYLAIPLYFNAFICTLSYKTGWIFFVDAQNQYSRGFLFLLPMIISLFYYVLMIIVVKKYIGVYKVDNKKMLVFILFIPMLGAMLQIIFKDILLIWGCVAIALLLYYILLREFQFKYDTQTGINNRSEFEREMELYIKKNKNLAIVVLDINNLKRNNDIYGHKSGDEIIFCSAKIIQNSFTNIGKAFRIGGDEFCVICEEISKESMNSVLAKLDNLLNEFNEKRILKIEIAYGFAFYLKNESKSIYAIFNQADKAMYEHKAKLKGYYG